MYADYAPLPNPRMRSTKGPIKTLWCIAYRRHSPPTYKHAQVGQATHLHSCHCTKPRSTPQLSMRASRGLKTKACSVYSRLCMQAVKHCILSRWCIEHDHAGMHHTFLSWHESGPLHRQGRWQIAWGLLVADTRQVQEVLCRGPWLHMPYLSNILMCWTFQAFC